jgi:uncharacterized tellurite resistance protein B-like protein
MIEILRRLLTGAELSEHRSTDVVSVAAAALLVEAARQDGRFDAAERETVLRLLGQFFGLDAASALDLLTQGEAAVDAAAQLFRFIQTINRHLDRDERIRLLEMLWEVVYADGTLSPYEDTLLRRVAALLGLSDRDRVEARQRVLAKRPR